MLRDRIEALDAVTEALEQVRLRPVDELRLPVKRVPNKIDLPPIPLLQWNLCQVLEKRARSRERWRDPERPLLADDLLVHYLGFLLFVTMNQWRGHRALALGSLLFGHPRQKIEQLTGDLFKNLSNARRIKSQLIERTMQRFRRFEIEPGPQGSHIVRGAPPTPEERELILATLRRWSAWRELAHPDSEPTHFERPLAETVFEDRWVAELWSLRDGRGEIVEDLPQMTREPQVFLKLRNIILARLHALACPACGGFPDLMAYDAAVSARPEPDRTAQGGGVDPEEEMIIPSFIKQAPGGSSGSSSRRSAEPLSEEDRRKMLAALDERSSRRARYRPGLLRIYLDGSFLATMDPTAHRHLHLPIDEDAGQLEIYGRDSTGELLLAVLPIPDPHDAEPSKSLASQVEHQRGQRLRARFTLLPGEERPFENDVLSARWLAEISYGETRPGRAAALAWQRWRKRLERGLVVRLVLVILGACLLVGAAGYGARRFATQLMQYNALVEELGFDRPFTVRFSTVGQRTVELELGVHSDVVGEVYVDWNDPSDPDPVGGQRIYPDATAGASGERLELLRVRHEYGTVQPGGLRTRAMVRIVPTLLPKVQPSSLTAEKLNIEKRLWILPQGVIVDPPEVLVDILTPHSGEVVGAVTEVEIRNASSFPIHVFAVDPARPDLYHHLATTPSPRFGEESTLTLMVDLSPLAIAGPFRLVALSATELEVTPQGTVDWRSIPHSAPRSEVELRHAGAILDPAPGTTVSGVGVVRGMVYLPDAYAAVLIRPSLSTSFWVQNDALRVTPLVEFPLRVTYGGRDSYGIYLAVTHDPKLFEVGSRLTERPMKDRFDRPVYWVGPVTVHQE